jgi:hypothetical protein
MARRLVYCVLAASVAARTVNPRRRSSCGSVSAAWWVQLDPAIDAGKWHALHNLYGRHRVILSNPPDGLVTAAFSCARLANSREIGSRRYCTRERSSLSRGHQRIPLWGVVDPTECLASFYSIRNARACLLAIDRSPGSGVLRLRRRGGHLFILMA